MIGENGLTQRALLLRGGAVEFTPAPAVVPEVVSALAPDVAISVTSTPLPEVDVGADARAVVHVDDALPELMALYAQAGVDTGSVATVDVSTDDEVHAVDAVDALDFELLPIFEEEADELLPQLQTRLRDWAANPADRSAADACMRSTYSRPCSPRPSAYLA